MITSTLKILSEADKEACELVKVSEEELTVDKETVHRKLWLSDELFGQ